MRPKGASQLQVEPRARRRGSGGARREPRGSLTAGREVPEHWTGPPEVMHPPEVTEGPGADGPLRAGDCNVGLGYSDVCGREIEPDRVRRSCVAVKTEQKLWSCPAQMSPWVARVATSRSPPLQRAARLDHDQPSIPRPFSGV